jgi:hypothetical protein
MLIVSKFNDYYDTAIIYGIDKSCVYKREQKEVFFDFDEKLQRFLGLQDSEYCKGLVGFCGDIYPVILSNHYLIDSSDADISVYYDQNSYDARPRKKQDRMKKYRFLFSSKYFLSDEDFWEKDAWNEYKEIFRSYNIPSFLIIGKKLILNPTLKKLNFMTIKEPAVAFQDIHMYLSGVLGVGEREAIEISDEDRAKKKGFDDWSFRQKGSKKRGRDK